MIRAWQCEADLKTAALKRLREHRRLDEIVQRQYWREGRGCNLGCLTHCNTDSHEAAERMFGIELSIGHWLEEVFEGLPQDECAQWVIDSAEAIPVGADMSKCRHHFAVWLLGQESPSAEGNRHESVKDAIDAVRILHERAASGDEMGQQEWSAARSAAWSAARSAAWSAARSAAGSAAWSAAGSAAGSAASSAALSAAWKSIAAKSLEIFSAAPVSSECESCQQEQAEATMIALRAQEVVTA